LCSNKNKLYTISTASRSIKETSPAASTMGKENEEEDYGALIYRVSQLRKAEAAAVGRKMMPRKRRRTRRLMLLQLDVVLVLILPQVTS
jgi:hypothetical protein